MGGLLAISIGSWTIIFRKGFTIRSARRATDEFETEFWSDRDLGSLYQQVRGDSGDDAQPEVAAQLKFFNYPWVS